MQLTTHFSLEEFTVSATGARLGLDNFPTPDVLENIKRVAIFMEELRLYFDRPIHVLSGYRSLAVNKAVGGSITSAHRFGLACDFTVNGRSNLWVAREITSMFTGWDQVIYEFGESGWVHVGLSTGVPRMQLLSAVRRDGRTVYLPGLHET
jgi:hypothetical protein